MALQIRRAVKYDAKLRMSIAGPSGAGKTYTGLMLATALAGEKGVLVIDTERGSASKYADLFTFDVVELDSFSPTLYVEAIKMAQENGYGALLIDSLSHAWNGTGGLLEMVDSIARRKYSGNSFAAWKDATPLQNQLIDAITRANLHVIATMRSKQEYALEKDERTGKTQPKKVGLAPIQRDGMEYEMDVHVEMDIDNTMIVQKSRCSALSGQIIPRPGASVAQTLKSWLSGAPAPTPAPTAPVNTPTEQRQPAAPQQDEQGQQQQPKITPQQIERIQKLCQTLGEAEPEGLAEMAYFDAKALYESLAAKYKVQKQAKQPTSRDDAPIQDKAEARMIDKAKARVEAMDMVWGSVKRDALHGQVEDKDLTVAQVAAINAVIDQYEAKVAVRSKAS